MTTKETYFFHRGKKKISDAFEDTNAMLFQIWVKKQSSGDWRPGFWSCVVVMTTVSWTASSSTNPGLFSPPALCTSYLLVTRDNPRWKKKRASRLHGPIQLLWWWYESKGDCVCWFLKQRGGLCLQLRISETENLWIHPVITIWRIYFFFYKAHAYAIVLGWFPLFFPRTVLCFCW